jgi:hypothetical protein
LQADYDKAVPLYQRSLAIIDAHDGGEGEPLPVRADGRSARHTCH